MLIKTAKRLGQNFLDLVFPVSCLVCGTEGVYLCENCLKKLPRLEKQICISCYKPAPFGKTHPDCVTRNTVDGAIAGLSYRDLKVKKIIEVFKYNFVSDLSSPISNAIIEAMDRQGLNDYFKDFIIVSVPLHQRRFNWRGFNQSELLAEELGKKLNVQINNKLITRSKYTEPQIKLTREERKRNMENAFIVHDEIRDKKILLVDDVVTSGSTANEIAKLLKQNKAAEVWIISAAHG